LKSTGGTPLAIETSKVEVMTARSVFMMVDTGIRIKGRLVIFLDKQCIEMPKNFRGPINHVALLALLAH
jgi:hypothetical protein